MWRADSDKPHRCPACWNVYHVGWFRPIRIRRWRYYSCWSCGARWAKWFWLPKREDH